MANTYTPQDVYQLFNNIVKQATGQTNLVAVDTSSFTAIGERLLNVSVENTLNAISTVMSKTLFAVRPYQAKLYTLYRDTQRWGAYTRKLTPLYKELEASSDWNTNLNPNQLDNGQSVDMYPINKPEMLQLNFIGTKVLQKHITRFRDQLALAFSSEREFMAFNDAIMVEWANEIALTNEQQARLTLINFATGMVNMNLPGVIDLTEGFNSENGTAYTRAQILTEHLTAFMQYFVSAVKILSDKLTDMSAMYHAQISGYDNLLRHTPKSKQRLIMYSPMFTKAEAMVYSEIFNPIYLDLGRRFERVNFWQSQQKPEQMSATPNILDVDAGNSKNGSLTTIPYVVGMLFDEDAAAVIPQFNYASTTPFNSRGGYYNMYYHWRFNSQVDYTENALLFIMSDGGTAPTNVNPYLRQAALVKATSRTKGGK